MSFAVTLQAQDISSPKFGYFAGGGVSTATGDLKPGLQLGAQFESNALPYVFGLSFEGGYVGPANGSKGSGIFSLNYINYMPLKGSSNKVVPFVTGGYSLLAGTGNGVDFGGGVDFVVRRTHALRIEARDYYTITGQRQHNAALRVGYVIYLWD
jgi:hypothetical protein